MNEKEAFPLVKKLLQKTADKKIPWEATADEHTFITTIKGNTFRIMRYGASEWQQPYTALMMVNDAGRTIWQLDDANEELPAHCGEDLRTLYDSAQRIGDRVGTRLSEALKSLDSL